MESAFIKRKSFGVQKSQWWPKKSKALPYDLNWKLGLCVPTRHSNIKQIQQTALSGLNSTMLIFIPSSLLRILPKTFAKSDIQYVIFSRNAQVVSFGSEAFSHSHKLKSLLIPNSVEILGDSCFECSKPQFIGLASGSKLRKIGQSAFSNSSISSIEIPSSMEELSYECFSDSKIKFIALPSNSKLKIIPYGAFSRCKRLSSLEIPPSVEEIHEFAFARSSLPSITFSPHSKLKEVYKGAFYSCSKLTSIEIPASVE